MRLVRGRRFPHSLLLVAQAAASILVAFAAADAGAANLPSGFREDRFLADLKEPTSVAFTPDGRIFASEKSGRIVVYDDLEDDEKTVAADLRKQVYDTGDRGLLSMALDPEFPSRPYLYALYTFDHVIGEDAPGEFPHWGKGPDYLGDPCVVPEGSTADVCPVSGRLVRLTVEGGGAGEHVVESGGEADEHELIGEDWCQQFSSHSVGDLQFDPDGNLYVSGGDGASFNVPDYGQLGFPGAENRCADPPGGVGDLLAPPTAEGGALRAQDLRTLGDPTGLNGAILRIDPDTGAGVPGNPFFGSFDANARRIVAYGFRNPFRIALDPAHGDLYAANVGWGSYEEIDRVPALPSQAPNSGWPCYEGPGPNPSYQDLGLSICGDLYAEPGAAQEPFLYYKHGTNLLPGDGCSPQFGSAAAALIVYPGGTFPAEYDGALFFADTVRGCIWTVGPGEDGRPDPANISPFLTEGGLYPGADFLVGPEGNLFYLKFYGEEDEGSLRRISYDPDSPVARLGASEVFGAPLDDVTLDASTSSDPNGETLTYAWDLDGNGSFESNGMAVRSGLDFPGDENVVVSVRVKDLTNKSDVARVTLYPGNTPPDPVIESPTENWAVGSEVSFSGHAADVEDDEGGDPGSGIGESGLFWKTQLYHCPDSCHAHPLRVFPGVAEGSFSAPDHDYPAYLKVILTATDSRGLTSTKEFAIFPRSVDLRIESDPAGVSIGAGVESRAAPYDLRVIEGSNVTLTAPSTALVAGALQPFRRWSNGGARVQTIVANRDETYVASYRDPPQPIDEPPRVAPQTSLRKKPLAQTRSRTARFAFAADQAGVSFRCKLDRKPYRPCRSPQVYRNLAPGRHVLRVLAIAADGTAEIKPAVFRWRVEQPKPRAKRARV